MKMRILSYELEFVWVPVRNPVSLWDLFGVSALCFVSVFGGIYLVLLIG